jgi:predicted enzyme related to lactoylglutathione lyase
MAGPIRALEQVAMPAHDMDRAVAFYRDTLQLPFIWSNGQLAFFQLGTVRLLLEKPESPAFDHPGSILYFDVEDIDSAVTDLQSRGVTFESPPHHIGDLGSVAVYMAFFPDSEGNLLALQSERPR